MIRTIILLCFFSYVSAAQTVPASYYQELQYRMIGPFRAGRTVGAVGIPSQPNVFFIGVNNGGVWKTADYGRTWIPLFDKESTGSIGDIAVSPAQPNIIYVGTGEGLHRPDLSVGDGMFKSTDGGITWKHIGLKDAQQIGRVIVHPANPDLVFVAVLGHPYGANDMRGVFRSLDGGTTWDKVLYINHNTAAMQVEFDPTNPEVLYADMWEHREGPWENGSFSGTNSGLYKSADGGSTWRKLINGLPAAQQGLGRIGVGISLSNSKRIYATVDAQEKGGIYRSDDAGENWKLISTEARVWGRGSDFAEIRVHPKNPEIVFAGNTAAYRSTDGGVTWTSFKGAPGGDDYHRIWINPDQPDIMIFAADQGATITVNGGKTWSSWYNQPTAQLYHISTDTQFPYWVYGGQQESGAIGVASRGDGGQLSFRDWIGVGADEYAYVVPDPKDPDIIYGGRVTRFNKKTGQTQNVAPEALRSGQYRMLRTLPLLFHPADPDVLLFATNVLWKTTTGGLHWDKISPDLTRKQPEVPSSIGDFKNESLNTMKQRAVIYSVSGSPVSKKVIWAGTDDGLVHVTNDGGQTWKDVTPSMLTSWDKVSQVDAGHFDVGTAFFSINAIRKDDLKPHIYKTKDGGISWKEIVKGLPADGPVNVVREDPKQKGLLFAGTERAVYFSIDEGENWQSLRMNMPATSVRDLVIHEDDLVIGTHGRSIWIMDNITPLRNLAQVLSQQQSYLFPPAMATRVRYNMFSDTPLPPEEPAGQNPPDGASIDYWMSKPAAEVRLEIVGQDGIIIRSYSSHDKPERIDTLSIPHPTYWIRPSPSISAKPGHHRFVWDLHYTEPKGNDRQFSIAAIYHNTPSGPQGPYVHPGQYTVRLIVDGEVKEQPITVRLDPRVLVNENDLQSQFDNSMICYKFYQDLQSIRESIDAGLANAKTKWPKGKKEQWVALRGAGAPGNSDVMYGSIYAIAPEQETVVGLQEKWLHMLTLLQSVDAKPTEATLGSITKLKEVSAVLGDRRNKLEQ
ncbi:MAG: glycoside hydrolase [Bacteroidota bacterium]